MFQFKQFAIQQEKAAMKVGTDGVLLGAWAPIENDPYRILDIGAGTGLIALMLAQRTDAPHIEALEIDADAHEEAVGNFEASPWNDRLFCFHASLDDFMDELEDEEYDLVISNPPFYAENVSSGDAARDRARQENSLPFEDLIQAAEVLLSEIGILAVIIPHKEESRFLQIAREEGLFAFKITRVKGTENSEVKRSLIALAREEKQPEVDELVIEITRHNYTEAYQKLTTDFYLAK